MIVNILKRNEEGYPSNLATIHSPPAAIYWTGVEPQQWLDKPKVAIVGSRKATPYGRDITAKLARQLAEAGVVIISGLAFGVDITAHQAALAANGVTVAVLPGSLHEIYPVSHIHTARDIVLKGTLITEYESGAINFKSNFIARNRIVSGLADAVVIPEAAVNSGSLHTARFALEQGKTVMAVPGNITSLASEGCNNLIKSGAQPVTAVDDIFFALKLKPAEHRVKTFSGTPQEERILAFIKDGLSAQEELAKAAKIDGSALASSLTMLELSGVIRPAGGGNWVIS